MSIDELIKKISNKLFEIFFVDDKKYGRQQEDGSYKLLKQKITPVTVDDMLRNKRSLLTYQEFHVVNKAFIKWICLDLDINKKDIDENDINKDNLKDVADAAQHVCDFLNSNEIPFLLEYSGRRGFHIWVVFEQLISKEEGYNLINIIAAFVRDKFSNIIIADKFPKTPYVNPNSKGIGFGVKLPLSINKASGKMSYFITDLSTFNFEYESSISDEKFIKNQFNIINSFQLMSIQSLKEFIDRHNEILKVNQPLVPRKVIVDSYLGSNTKLDDILNSLRKCHNLNKILFEYEKGLGGKERSILVGLLGSLKSVHDPKFGYNILMELFSNIKGFNEDITKKKLKYISYFKPVTCQSLGSCEACKENGFVSPVQFIEGVSLENVPNYGITNLDSILFNKIKKALHKYSFQNDEVPLYPLLKHIEELSFESITSKISDCFNEKKIPIESYRFERNEINKKRILYNLDPVNNFISTYFTFILNTIYYTHFSNNSYGYKFSNSFYLNNIYESWFYNWANYTSNVENVLFNKEYGNYFLIKIDIKSFYDRIDLKRLKVKLFEEAPIEIRQKLEEFKEDDLKKYKSIIKYLIDLSSKITGKSDYSLPQGPAYARYLAEIYLFGLDKLIEETFIVDQKREFYNRFVDDIFIFVETEERANNLFSEIKNWLSLNNLEFNTDKTKIENVKVYAESGEYQKFKDNFKYDINKVNKNKSTFSEKDIQEALSKLDSLTNEVNFGLKDNIRFIYSQFKGDPRIEFIKSKISKRLPFSIDGRGALYMIFYADLIQNNGHFFWSLTENINDIVGLSLSHYLNTILLNEETIDINRDKIAILLNNLLERKDINEVDQLLIVTIALKINLNNYLPYPKEVMFKALEVPSIKYTLSQWDLILEKIADLKENNYIKELERIIYSNSYEKEFLNELANYSFIRFSEWYTSGYEFISSESDLVKYYHCLGFLTLFCKNRNGIIESWKILLNQSKHLGKFENDNHQFLWINKLDDFNYNDFSPNSYSLILHDKEGASLSKSGCKNGFLQQYKNVLLMLLFAKDKINHFDDFRRDIADQIDQNSSLFMKWVNDPNVTLYPDSDDICLKNIALNGIIVLRNSEKFFTYSLNKKELVDVFSYINIDEKGEKENGIEFQYKTSNEYLKGLFFNLDLVKSLKQLNYLIELHEKFKVENKVSYPFFYSPFDSINRLPAVPYYSCFSQIVDDKGNIVDLDLATYWNNIDYFFKMKLEFSDDIKLLEDSENQYNFNIKNLDERFFPKSKLLGNFEEVKINFLRKFVSEIEGNDTEGITSFQYHYFWISALKEICIDLRNTSSIQINFLELYFSTFTDEVYELDLFFSVNDKFKIEQNTLQGFYQTIRNSIEIFQSEIYKTNTDFVAFFDEYIPKALRREGDDSLTLDLFKSGELKINERDNRIKGRKEYLCYLNEELVDIQNIYIYNYFKDEFELEEISNLNIKLVGQKYFYFLIEQSIYLYFVERQIVKSFERIEKRKEIYDDLISGSSEQHIRFSKLFPQNPYFEIGRRALESFSDRKLLIDKLKMQYSKEYNIDDRIINWLTIFNEKSIDGSKLQKYMQENNIEIETLYKAILKVLVQHHCLSHDDLTEFRKRIVAYNDDESVILFTIKRPNEDRNGLFRLLNKCGFDDRELDFEKKFRTLCSTDKQYNKVIFITDNYVSGQQTAKAFKYYLSSFSKLDDLVNYNDEKIDGKKSPNEERYFTFPSLSSMKNFQNNLKMAEKIIFFSPIMASKFETKVKDVLGDELNKNLDFENLILVDDTNYLFEFLDNALNSIYLNVFKALLDDNTLINRLFSMDKETKKQYKKWVTKELDAANLLFRVGSLPSKHLKLFTLKPKKGEPLLDYVKNWK